MVLNVHPFDSFHFKRAQVYFTTNQRMAFGSFFFCHQKGRKRSENADEKFVSFTRWASIPNCFLLSRIKRRYFEGIPRRTLKAEKFSWTIFLYEWWENSSSGIFLPFSTFYSAVSTQKRFIYSVSFTILSLCGFRGWTGKIDRKGKNFSANFSFSLWKKCKIAKWRQHLRVVNCGFS